jgi:hypothetical protein
MANDISSNPWYFDAVTANPFHKYLVKFKGGVWQAQAAGGRLTIVDLNNKVVVDEIAAVAGPINLPDRGWVRGLAITSLPAGDNVTIDVGSGSRNL